MGSATSILPITARNASTLKSNNAGPGAGVTDSLSPISAKYIADFQLALDNLPKVINSELRKCMFLFAIYPSFRNDFMHFFSSGKWVNEFLDSNSNVMPLMLISSLAFSSQSLDSADSCHPTPTNTVAPTAPNPSFLPPPLAKSKSMQIEIRGDTTRDKFRSSQHQARAGNNSTNPEFSRVDWLNSCCDDQSRELLAVFLTIAYPIYLSSYEFQSWLEYTVYDEEEDQIMKRRIEKEVNSLRTETEDTQVEAHEDRSKSYCSYIDDDNVKYSDHPAQFEVTLHRCAESKIRLLHQRYSSSSDLLSRSVSPRQQERFLSSRKRLKSLIQSVISYFSFTHHDIRLENMLATTNWSQTLLSFLQNIRIPIVIGCIRNRGKKSTFREMIMQGIQNMWHRSDFAVVYMNKAYEELTLVTLADAQTSSMSDLLFGKVPHILEQHSVHSSTSPTHHNNNKIPISSPSSSSSSPRKTLLAPNTSNNNVAVATASSTIQMTVESTRKNTQDNSATSTFINVTIMKPVHHVAADPDYHYVIATQYDLTPFLLSPLSMDASLAINNESGTPMLNRGKSQLMRQMSLSASQWQKTNNSSTPNTIRPASANTFTTVAMSNTSTLSCVGSISDRTAASEMSSDSGTSATTTMTAAIPATDSHISECCLETSCSSISSTTVSMNKLGMKFAITPVNISTNSNNKKDGKAMLSPAVYTQFNKDLPWIEDCLNLVPQFLY